MQKKSHADTCHLEGRKVSAVGNVVSAVSNCDVGDRKSRRPSPLSPCLLLSVGYLPF